MRYNAPKPPELVAEDKQVERFRLGIDRAQIRIIPVEEVFER